MDNSENPEPELRDPANKDLDKSALQAIAQATINVELFTIPLYMVSMYSIQGMHQITSKGNDFYQGRLWPGAAPSRDPKKDENAQAFNHFFSVFIDEMLHLQLASNIAKVLGVMPTYTSSALQTDDYGWKCYGPDQTVIPHIIDFQDTVAPYNTIKVKLDTLSLDQNRLFLAIEENEEDAQKIIDPEKIGNYFPTVPFTDWKINYTEENLPMFGTIGWLYKCLWEYLDIEYKDHTRLFDYVFNRGSLERDLFNAMSAKHKPEYPKMRAMATGEIDSGWAKANVLDMINAITDQGEGSGIAEEIRARLHKKGMLEYHPVKEQFQPDEAALNYDYPNYTDTGAQDNPSGNTVARSNNASVDHHDRFLAIKELLETGKVVTWDQWHASGNKWTPDMLKTTGYDQNKWPLPKAEDIAGALNTLKEDASNYELFSKAAVGSIAGITRLLSNFWTNETASFPFPSMYGSGDRVSICWAVFGKYPDITEGIAQKVPGKLYHACQGMELPSSTPVVCGGPGPGKELPDVAVFHSCRGSNTCKAEGGCGFVQEVGSQSIICGFKVMAENMHEPGMLEKTIIIYSAPSDNSCAAFGGCAVPISDSQLYPAPNPLKPTDPGKMEVNDFEGPNQTPTKIGEMNYAYGQKVYDIAWEAYIQVLKHRGVTNLPNKPAPDPLRLAFPPST
ncbi:MAG TPA: ferritin-like domain-containing protein [Pyrinomonadaceae bacterium]|nr:ferritin-like domain-containing protein [Pyrinomonadaceae bacterium]